MLVVYYILSQKKVINEKTFNGHFKRVLKGALKIECWRSMFITCSLIFVAVSRHVEGS